MPSEAWKYFKNLKLENKIQCIICNKTLNRGDSSTKALWSHLATHPDVLEKAKKSQQNPETSVKFYI